MAHSPPYILIGLASVLTFVHHCLSGGSIQVTLIEYEPRKWKQKNEQECEKKVCGIYFQVKFYEEGLDGRWRSDVWPMIETQVFRLRNVDPIMIFGKRLSSTQANPMRRNFTSGMFGLRIFVVETGAASPLEEFNSIFSITEFPPGDERDHTFYSENYPYSSITMRVLFTCHKFYFGPKCLTFCEPKNDDRGGHFNCSAVGEKSCLPGWLNISSNCLYQDFCASSPCHNNASCSQTFANFSCACPPDFRGALCDVPLTACDRLNPCRNGATCVPEGQFRWHCDCTAGFTGTNCTKPDLCASEPCQNEGRCLNVEDGFRCDCGPEFQGELCEERVKCLPGPCQNNGTCERDGAGTRCVCPPPFFGKDCSNCNASLGPCVCRGPLCRENEVGRPEWSKPNQQSYNTDLLFWIAIAAICGIVSGGFFGPAVFYVMQRRKGWLHISSSRKLYTPDLEAIDPTTECFLPGSGPTEAQDSSPGAPLIGISGPLGTNGLVAAETNC